MTKLSATSSPRSRRSPLSAADAIPAATDRDGDTMRATREPKLAGLLTTIGKFALTVAETTAQPGIRRRP
jgi:hypothetical protein